MKPIARNGAQLCFAGSALLNVLSQAFFARAGGADRDAWLSGTLLLGTAASLAGVPAAQRFGLPGRPLLSGLVLVIGIGALFGLTFTLESAALFAAVTVVLRFFMQYGTQELDRRAVLLAGEASRRTNDIVGLAMRFGGMLVGPLWFSLVKSSVASLFAIALMTALAVWTVALTASAPQPVMTNAAPSQLSADERVVLWAARVIYASYYLLASSIISVLTDLHHLPDAVKRGGLVVTVVYASAIVTTVIELARRRTTRRPVLDMLPAPVAMIFVGFALPSGATAMTGVELAGGVLLGVAFARYQLPFRDRATAEAMQHRPALLAAYNNLGTTSALLGYAVMSGLVAWSRHAGASYAAWAGSGVVLLGLAGAALVLMARARRQPATQAT
ncbi:MAG: hypothetical protein DI536_05055 [Archangium gephyra]|uniref:MFS transporter n=1 Tax=Archangium gephyra TaxID=48 RepID=A0A2W5TPU3_9BACT|nr:MAG: hypothetical protein DI536_05055 [Archangium gephyra]